MIIQTLNAEFLIESNTSEKGCLFIFSNNKEELQRFFGSGITELHGESEWSFKTKTCKQDFANALIHLVKEINYAEFPKMRSILF